MEAMVKTKNIVRTGWNPRKLFSDDKQKELEQSITASGIRERLIVRPSKKKGKYDLVDGDRRLTAAESLKLAEVPVHCTGDRQAGHSYLVGAEAMRFPEIDRLLGVLEDDEEISTHEANEYFPKLSPQQMASKLRRDDRMEMTGKAGDAYNKVAMWRKSGK